MTETNINIAGIFILIILFVMMKFVLKLVANNKLFRTKYLLYLTRI